MWQRFPENARRVIFYAQEEAQQWGTSEVEPEHILLGLLREADHDAAQVLANLGIDPIVLRAQVERQLGPSKKPDQAAMMMTPRSKRVIDLSYDEAQLLQDDYIGTEHLLLGILREREELPDRAQGDLDLTLDKTREAVKLYRHALGEPEKSPARGPEMWRRFTERTRKAMTSAQEQAAQLRSRQVAPEHLLLGLIREEVNVAVRILDRLGIKRDDLRAAILEHLTSTTDNDVQVSDVGLTPESKRVIDLCYEEARLLNNNYIGTEHLLLGLIAEGASLAAQILIELGATLERTRAEATQMQSGQ